MSPIDFTPSGHDGSFATSTIDEGNFEVVNGIEQWITIRGMDRANPALLIFGGPGGALSALAPLYADWERHFTVVQWDQPGGGATHGRNGDAGTGPLSLERLVRDGVAVAELVRERLGKKRVVVLGFSGGTMLSLTIASRRPDLISACVGSGQVVDWARQDSASYVLVLQRERAAGNTAAVAELELLGPPPYPDTRSDAIKSKYAGAFTPLEAAALAAVLPMLEVPPANATYVAHGVARGDPRALATAAYDKMRLDIVSFDARRLGRVFRVPLYFFQGEQDTYTVTAEVCDYLEEIEAPRKLLAILPDAGHSTFLASAALLAQLLEHVRPIAMEAER